MLGVADYAPYRLLIQLGLDKLLNHMLPQPAGSVAVAFRGGLSQTERKNMRQMFSDTFSIENGKPPNNKELFLTLRLG